MLKKLLKEPLIHFAIGAALLFGLSDILWPEEGMNRDTSVIEITEETLIQYLQYQSGVFDPDRAEKAFAVMPEDKKRQLIDRYVEEEALYREAIALGLDQDDRAIRLRLVQQASMLAEAILPQDETPDEQEILAYFDQHRDKYVIDPSITFTHVFLDPRKNTPEEAAALLQDLRTREVPFEMAGRYGNRFLYHVNYVERTPEFVSAHFGEAFTAQVFDPVTPHNEWAGPFVSVHGAHLVMIRKTTSRRMPDFDEVKGQVVGDYLRDLREKTRTGNIKRITDRYTVVLPESMREQE